MEEAALITGLKNGDEKAYRFLVDSYYERVYWHIRRLVVDHEDADDLTQEAFVKVYRKIDQFKGESEFFTWLYRIATNEALGFLRKKQRYFFLPLQDYDGEMRQKIEEQMPDADAIERRLQMALQGLPAKQRAVFNLRYYDEMSFEQMSKVLKTSVGGVKANYHHASKKIKEQLELGGDELKSKKEDDKK
ncbi:MAG: sigma-70 family RNA polymerase sigma factor [Cyclobacteriaceae bacterium]|nr:sigma-70 family RNA polymerase sigma factor [Cyclobacteriaceae bacterium]MCH8514822.1 sigma-70 family RNA polymerase sigma factor [Cyclobacteriaceae bacterium]